MGLAALLPPLVSLARSSELANALQFAALALAVPALVVVGAPWQVHGPIRRLADASARRGAPTSGTAALACEVVAVVGWRTSAAVDAIGHHPWLLAVEAVTLVAAGIGLWLQLVPSFPMVPGTTASRRIVLAALAMWTVWIVAYVAGMAHGQGYPGFHHHSGDGLSGVADKQLATALLFVAAAAAYLPAVFANLFAWLTDEERRGSDATTWRLRPERRTRDEVRSAH